MDTHDEIIRAIAIVSSIKDNLPSDPYLELRWVDECHRALAKVEKTMTVDLAEFRVEQSSIGPIVVSGNYGTGQVNYSDESFCDRAILLQKSDALLNYLNLLLQPPPAENRRIGFDQPK
jgi:hypothetical protein